MAFYRVDSRIIPYASHPGNRLAWWDEFAVELDWIGQFAHRQGLRLEMHPGHHCLLNSPSPETVALSILELGWHVHFFDAMRLDASHKLVVRVGGTFGDKTRAIDRFVSVINGLPEGWRVRLAIENDRAWFGVAEVLEVSMKTGLPVVVACHHRESGPGLCLPVARSVAHSFATWKSDDGPPIVHLGCLADGRGRPSRVEPGDLQAFQALTPGSIPFDCLIEGEGGDAALIGFGGRRTTSSTIF